MWKVRAVQIGLALALVAAIVAFNQGGKAFTDYMGPDFTSGFAFGVVLMLALFGLAQWLDPPSRR
jgi:hypothetical protein